MWGVRGGRREEQNEERGREERERGEREREREEGREEVATSGAAAKRRMTL